jgi:hypothetical protein
LSSFREAGGPAFVFAVAVAVAFAIFSCHPSAKLEDLLLSSPLPLLLQLQLPLQR